MLKEKRGITLIALVVTIIVLLILAGVSISMVVGNDGVIQKASYASEEERYVAVVEQRDFWKTSKQMDKTLNTKDSLSIRELVDKMQDGALINEEEAQQIITNGYVTINKKNIVFYGMIENINLQENKIPEIEAVKASIGKIKFESTAPSNKNEWINITYGEGEQGWLKLERTDGKYEPYLRIAQEGGVVLPPDCSSFFSYDMLTEIEGIENLDTSNVTNMSNMFKDTQLTKLDLSNWDVSNVTDMSGMFWGCELHLEELNLSNWDTSKVTNMSGMFTGCKNVTQLDLSSFDTSGVTDMSWMFSGCVNLQNLILGENFNTENVTTIKAMFMSCINLQTRLNFDPSSVQDYSMFLEIGWENLAGDIDIVINYNIKDEDKVKTIVGTRAINSGKVKLEVQ